MASVKRESDKIPGLGYLDGVPVKICEKFRPPRKVTLPLSYQQRCPVDLLNEDYDFSLEQQVVELAETKRKAREAAERAKTEKVASVIEEFTRAPNVDGQMDSAKSQNWHWTDEESESLASKSEEPVRDATTHSSFATDQKADFKGTLTNPVMSNVETNDILQPIPHTKLTNGIGLVKPDVTITSTLNLADFEAESSPFDNIALTTLNDMEELRRVLQSVSASQQKSEVEMQSLLESSNPVPSEATDKAIAINARCNPFTPYANGLVTHDSAFSDPSPELGKNITVRHRAISEGPDVPSFLAINGSSGAYASNAAYSLYPSVASWSQDSTSHGSNPSMGIGTQISPPSGHVASTAPYQHTPVSTGNPACVPMYSSYHQPNGSENEENYACIFPLRTSRSTPDLLKELGAGLPRDKKKLSQAVSSPQRPNSTGNAGIPEISQNEWPSHMNAIMDKNGHMSKNLPKQLSKARPQDSYPDLSLEALALVRHVSDMGFPRSRVARAVHKIGLDDKKVVEHLCLVQSLIEKGYKPEQAEVALHLHDQNEIRAQEYLDLMMQFKDLGFEEHLIKEALLRTSNDRDRALDYLVS